MTQRVTTQKKKLTLEQEVRKIFLLLYKSKMQVEHNPLIRVAIINLIVMNIKYFR